MCKRVETKAMNERQKKDLQIQRIYREQGLWCGKPYVHMRFDCVPLPDLVPVLCSCLMMMMCRHCRCIWFDWWHYFFSLRLLRQFFGSWFRFTIHILFISLSSFIVRDFFVLHSLFGYIRNPNFVFSCYMFHVYSCCLFVETLNTMFTILNAVMMRLHMRNFFFRLIRRPFLLCSLFLMVKWFVYRWMEWDSFFPDDAKSISELQIVNNRP